MITLYIDTHSEKIELAIFQNGKLLKLSKVGQIYQHSSMIMPMLAELLSDLDLNINQLSDIIVVNGPGSFTGIRLGCTIAKTLAFTLQIPIRVMSSLLIKAVSNTEKGHIWFVEAEKNGYFVGEFNDLDELLNDYFYIKKSDYNLFKEQHHIVEEVILDYDRIYSFAQTLLPLNPHLVNPLYVKLIEVQK